MKIEEYDVIRIKDGRELTILLIHGDGEAYEVTDQEDAFSIERDEVAKVIWKAKIHSKVD
ncbi:hypothetical protein [Enterococcus xiangfangensis]|uniref:Phage protein n=1 Tax=Enterococcus xiangfangensis TaxID=1296537 RepID=A0ABU3FE18_9ENTE|nr:hypothetical protein [Enterococcus xiangfangensis]MDT2760750.1 hypothetical protein [Enterococcus xiangfangensis]